MSASTHRPCSATSDLGPDCLPMIPGFNGLELMNAVFVALLRMFVSSDYYHQTLLALVKTNPAKGVKLI